MIKYEVTRPKYLDERRIISKITFPTIIGKVVRERDLGGFVRFVNNIDSSNSWIFDDARLDTGAFLTENSVMLDNSLSMYLTSLCNQSIMKDFSKLYKLTEKYGCRTILKGFYLRKWLTIAQTLVIISHINLKGINMQDVIKIQQDLIIKIFKGLEKDLEIK